MANQMASDSSPFVKMRQMYWETKQSFNKSLGQLEDSCIISSDSELDMKLELLQAADNSFITLTAVLLNYRSALRKYINAQEKLGEALVEYGAKDSTAAGELLRTSGNAISKVAHRQTSLKTILMELFQEVQTFQFKAIEDVFQTVTKMEKVRRSYRSGLMWLKNESEGLDPDFGRKLKNFRKVQEHIKRLKVRFDRVKLKSMQKIDLLLLSRSNLFSHTLVPYSKTFTKICKESTIFLNFVVENIPLYLSYNFVKLKELNPYSKAMQASFQLIQSQEQSMKINSKSKTNSAEKSKNTMVDNFSIKSDYPIKNIKDVPFDFSTSEKNLDCSIPKNGCLLINLNEKDQSINQSSVEITRCKTQGKSSISKYSDDLLLLNLEPKNNVKCNFSVQNESLKKEFENIYDLCNFEFKQQDKKLSGELHFWNLIENCGTSENCVESTTTIENRKSVLSPSKPASKVKSQSKWDEILAEFDPFLNRSSGLTAATDTLEPC